MPQVRALWTDFLFSLTQGVNRLDFHASYRLKDAGESLTENDAGDDAEKNPDGEDVGAPDAANSSHDLLCTSVGSAMPCFSSATGLTVPDGWLPADQARVRPWPR